METKPCEDHSTIVFARGEPPSKVDREDIFDALFEEIKKDGWK